MLDTVILEDGGTVSVHTRIKDLCKEARNRRGLSNQTIADAISKRFGIEDFSVNTVNNFFSERSKATTIYTTGYICAVLDISIDAVFGIEHAFSSEEQVELVRQIADLRTDARLTENRMQSLEKAIEEKNQRLEQAHTALSFFRCEAEKNRGKISTRLALAIVLTEVLTLLILMGVIFLK